MESGMHLRRPIVRRVCRHGCCVLGFAVRGTHSWRAHSCRLGHAGGAGGHWGVGSVVAPGAMAASHGARLARALALHWASGVHPHAVGHPGTAVAATVVGGSRVVAWAILCSLRSILSSRIVLRVGGHPWIHGTSRCVMRRHRGPRLWTGKLGAALVSLHIGHEPSVLSHGGAGDRRMPSLWSISSALSSHR